MNLLRKIKINELHPIQFTLKEEQIINFIRISIASLTHIKAASFSDLKYQDYTYFVHKNSIIYLRLNLSKDTLYVDKNFLYQLSFDKEIQQKHLLELVKYFYKKELSKKEPYCGALALNYVDNIFKEDSIVEIPL